jgi:uncharacterized protein YecE (DUF72 family)
MEKQWYIGCSGFYYREWKEIFYPKGLAQSKWFDFYCQHFNTLELNVTFYRFPELKLFQNWYNKSPEDFIFSAKVPKIVTHNKKFVGTEDVIKSFYDVLINGLQEKTGPVLFQLPPSMQYSEEKLEQILSHADPAFNNVIEFRNVSWWRKEVMDTLSKHHITFCGVSFPGLPDDVVINTPQPYYRFHGVPKLYYSGYDDAFLEKVFKKISSSKKAEKAFLYFNNTAAAEALHNARYLQQLATAK